MSLHAEKLDEIAASYGGEILQGWERIYQLKWRFTFSKLLGFTNRKNALELGCADGAMSLCLAKSFDFLTVVDGSREFLELTQRALRNQKNTRYVRSLFEGYETSEKFDAIFMTHILEHLGDPVCLLKRAAHWLAPGGVILVNVPNAHSLHRRVGVKLGMLDKPDSLNEQDRKLGHLRVYTPDLLREHVEEAGLRIQRLGGIMLKPLSNRQMNDWDEKLLSALFELGDDFPELSSELYAVATSAAHST